MYRCTIMHSTDCFAFVWISSPYVEFSLVGANKMMKRWKKSQFFVDVIMVHQNGFQFCQYTINFASWHTLFIISSCKMYEYKVHYIHLENLFIEHFMFERNLLQAVHRINVRQFWHYLSSCRQKIIEQWLQGSQPLHFHMIL